MELRLPLEMSPGREAACRAVFGTWGFFPNDARKNCPFETEYSGEHYLNQVTKANSIRTSGHPVPLDMIHYEGHP